MIAALLAAAALATAIVTTAPIDPVARLAERITQLANRDRAARGVALLRVDARLTQAAQGKAEDMLRRDYFDHVDPDGRAPWDLLDSIGYRFVSVGENISSGLSDPERMHERWTASPPHRRNILSKDFTHIGVGAVREPAGSFRVVVLFARPAT